ncbi:MAG TPA: trigger factor [Candidatus Nanopelagicaceae bacterium]|nr:trigger factor [Candidatus Nanopelagicaceae bacterium]
MSQSSMDVAALEVEVERLPAAQAKVTVTAPAEVVDRAIARALIDLSRRVRLPGFRPGKAPAAVVERAVGWDAVQQEATDLLLPDLYRRAVEQAQLDPVSQPTVAEADLERGQPFRFVASVLLRPEVTLGDYRQIRVPLEVKDVPEEDVAGTLEALRQRYAQLTDAADREVQAQDVVTAELTMHHGDQVIGTPNQLQTLDLQRGQLLPGMADQLLGARVGGDPIEITVTLPEDYAREELRGEMVVVTANVTGIQAKSLPELDDNLAAIAGRGETLEELKGFIRDELREELAAEAQREQANKALELLLGMTKVDLPEAMIQAEIDHQVRDLEARLAESGIALDALLAAQDRSLEQLRGERRQAAVERVRLDLALGQVAKQEALETSDLELAAALSQILPKGTSKEARERSREPIRREVMISKANNFVLALARGDQEPASPSAG